MGSGPSKCSVCEKKCPKDICGEGTTWSKSAQTCVLNIDPSSMCGENTEWDGQSCKSTVNFTSSVSNDDVELKDIQVKPAPKLSSTITENNFDTECPYNIFDSKENKCGKTHTQLTAECLEAFGGLDMQSDLNDIVTCVYGKHANCAEQTPHEFTSKMTECMHFKLPELGDICDEKGMPVGGDKSCVQFWNRDRLYRAFQTGGSERVCGGKDLDIRRTNIWDNCASFSVNKCPVDSGCARVDPWNLGGLLLAREFVLKGMNNE